jgi:hypothetical protein
VERLPRRGAPGSPLRALRPIAKKELPAADPKAKDTTKEAGNTLPKDAASGTPAVANDSTKQAAKNYKQAGNTLPKQSVTAVKWFGAAMDVDEDPIDLGSDTEEGCSMDVDKDPVIAKESPRSRAARLALPGDWVPRRPPIALRASRRPSTRIAAMVEAEASAAAAERGRHRRIAAKRAAVLVSLIVAARAELHCRAARDAESMRCGTVHAFGPIQPTLRSPLKLAAPPTYAAQFTKPRGPGSLVSWALYPAGHARAGLVEHAARIVGALGKEKGGYIGKSAARDRPRARATDTVPPEALVVPNFCVFAPHTWHQESWTRLLEHLYHFRLAVVLYASEDEGDALGAEEFLQAKLPAAAGIELSNADPYNSGKRGGPALAGYYGAARQEGGTRGAWGEAPLAEPASRAEVPHRSPIAVRPGVLEAGDQSGGSPLGRGSPGGACWLVTLLPWRSRRRAPRSPIGPP